jgi:hypothetical protein
MALVLVSLVLFLSRFFDTKSEGMLAGVPTLALLGCLIVAVVLAGWVRRRDKLPPIEPSEGGVGGPRSSGGVIIAPQLRAANPDRPTDAGIED